MSTPSNPSMSADPQAHREDFPSGAAFTLASQPSPVPRWQAWLLLFIFSMAQLLDIFNVTAPTVALPSIAEELDVHFDERQWGINAYALTFGAFLLTVSVKHNCRNPCCSLKNQGGRFSAIYGPKPLFVSGFAVVGICSIINGFSVNGPMLFVFRAFQGIGAFTVYLYWTYISSGESGAAMTIPSALSMITTLFPGRGEQDRALALYDQSTLCEYHDAEKSLALLALVPWETSVAWYCE